MSGQSVKSCWSAQPNTLLAGRTTVKVLRTAEYPGRARTSTDDWLSRDLVPTWLRREAVAPGDARIGRGTEMG
jgi:hypothetical protein